MDPRRAPRPARAGAPACVATVTGTGPGHRGSAAGRVGHARGMGAPRRCRLALALARDCVRRSPAGGALLLGRSYGAWVEVHRSDGIHGWVLGGEISGL